MSRFGIVSISHPWWRPHHHHHHQRENIWDAFSPSRLFDQNFGLGLTEDDLTCNSLLPGFYYRPRQLLNRQVSGLSEVKCDNTKFQVNLDVNQFSPNELTVKTVDNTIVVHAKHEERSDEHGYISREFTRRYVLPDGVEPEAVVSSLTHDGVLTIEAPRKVAEEPKPVERDVPIAKLEAPAAQDKADSK